jgi:hypothetical protein
MALYKIIYIDIFKSPLHCQTTPTTPGSEVGIPLKDNKAACSIFAETDVMFVPNIEECACVAERVLLCPEPINP